MPAKRKAQTIEPRRRRAATRTAPGKAPVPQGVVRDDDDPRVIALWDAAVETYAGKMDAQLWGLAVGAIEVARLFYANGSVAAWSEYRRTIKEIDHVIGQTETAAPAARPLAAVVRLA
jgi:hypothetical protein